MMSHPRLKVLISAYACEPDAGSEPGIGWNWVAQIARFHDVWVITRENNRAAIEAKIADLPLPNVHVVGYDLPRWARFWKKGQRGVRIYYYLWQIAIYGLARTLHAKEKFDLVHHVTLGAFWQPSFLALLPVPFVWGTVGGGESAPRPFYDTFDERGRRAEWIRDTFRAIIRRDPMVGMTARRARAIFATTEETAVAVRQMGVDTVDVLSHAALPAEDLDRLGKIPPRQEGPFRAVSIGRMLYWKGFHLGIEAFAKLLETHPDAEYWFIGNGPEEDRLKAMVESLNIGKNVRFLGLLSRDEVLDTLASCDILLHPSLHDSGGWVCVESMAAARPVVCLDLGGPAEQVTPETGVKVPAHRPEQSVNDLATALTHLASDDAARLQMGALARQRAVNVLQWDAKGEQVAAIYDRIMAKGTAR